MAKPNQTLKLATIKKKVILSLNKIAENTIKSWNRLASHFRVPEWREYAKWAVRRESGVGMNELSWSVLHLKLLLLGLLRVGVAASEWLVIETKTGFRITQRERPNQMAWITKRNYFSFRLSPRPLGATVRHTGNHLNKTSLSLMRSNWVVWFASWHEIHWQT